MSASKKEVKGTYELTGWWAGAWKTFAGIGVVGLVGSLVGMMTDPRRFAFSWLYAYCTVLAVALGAIFFVLIQRLTSAGWSVTVRRTAEFFSYGILAMIPLALPFLLQMGHLFPWLGGHGEHHDAHETHSAIPALIGEAHAQTPEAHAQGHDDHAAAPAAPAAPAVPHEGAAPAEAPHAAPAAALGHGAHAAPAAAHEGGHGGAEARAHAEHAAHQTLHATTMAKKAAWLNKGFFMVRALLYFIVWALLATRLFGYSTAQDKSKDPKLTLAAQGFSAPGTFLFGLSLTFAAFDWIMSLEPTWFSTIFGVYYFATGVVSSLAVIILVTMALRDAGPLKDVVTVEHYHDLGKLMFGFTVFWAYIGFSQFMLIWYAALPEETTWYHARWDVAPWDSVSLFIVLGHFVLPFLWLISRNFKRNLGRLKIGAAILLAMHVVDIYWFVMPNYLHTKPGFSFHWLDLTTLLAVGGLYAAFVFHRMTKHPLIPVGDPRLKRSLAFQNA